MWWFKIQGLPEWILKGKIKTQLNVVYKKPTLKLKI